MQEKEKQRSCLTQNLFKSLIACTSCYPFKEKKIIKLNQKKGRVVPVQKNVNNGS